LIRKASVYRKYLDFLDGRTETLLKSIYISQYSLPVVEAI
jgi:hypothetical protein